MSQSNDGPKMIPVEEFLQRNRQKDGIRRLHRAVEDFNKVLKQVSAENTNVKFWLAVDVEGLHLKVIEEEEKRDG